MVTDPRKETGMSVVSADDSKLGRGDPSLLRSHIRTPASLVENQLTSRVEFACSQRGNTDYRSVSLRIEFPRSAGPASAPVDHQPRGAAR